MTTSDPDESNPIVPSLSGLPVPGQDDMPLYSMRAKMRLIRAFLTDERIEDFIAKTDEIDTSENAGFANYLGAFRFVGGLLPKERIEIPTAPKDKDAMLRELVKVTDVNFREIELQQKAAERIESATESTASGHVAGDVGPGASSTTGEPEGTGGDSPEGRTSPEPTEQ